MAIVCPVDGKDDAIQKVLAVYKEGWRTVRGYSYLSETYRSETQITKLARELAPPVAPSKPLGLLNRQVDVHIIVEVRRGLA